jgi:CubicO group peptidase (beta-lactamase class C family)
MLFASTILICGTMLVAACAAPANPATVDGADARIERVIHGLRRAVQVKGAAEVTYDLPARLAHYHTPGVTIAVVDSGRIVWARAYGVKEAGTSDSLTPATLFEAGSISKPVAATVML